MKTKKYKKSERKNQSAEEPSVAYESRTLDNSTLEIDSDGETSTDSLTGASHVSPNAHTYEEMKADLRERIDKIEAGEATFHSNEEVFSSIRERYEI